MADIFGIFSIRDNRKLWNESEEKTLISLGIRNVENYKRGQDYLTFDLIRKKGVTWIFSQETRQKNPKCQKPKVNGQVAKNI